MQTSRDGDSDELYHYVSWEMNQTDTRWNSTTGFREGILACYKEWCGQQDKGSDFSPVLSTGEAIAWVLGAVLGLSI